MLYPSFQIALEAVKSVPPVEFDMKNLDNMPSCYEDITKFASGNAVPACNIPMRGDYLKSLVIHGKGIESCTIKIDTVLVSFGRHSDATTIMHVDLGIFMVAVPNTFFKITIDAESVENVYGEYALFPGAVRYSLTSAPFMDEINPVFDVNGKPINELHYGNGIVVGRYKPLVNASFRRTS